MDPVNSPGVKIPDEITLPSFMIQVLTKFLISSTIGTGGNNGCGFFRTLGCSGVNSYSLLTAGATNGIWSQSAQTAAWQNTLASQLAAYRLVSAKATMSNLGSPNTIQGRHLLAFVAPNQSLVTVNSSTWPQTAAGTFTSTVNENVLVQLPGLADVPASKVYVEARYLPTDDISRSYETQGSTSVGTLRGPLGLALPTYGGFCGIWDGATASTGQIVEVNIWENWECIPQSNIVSIAQPTTSLSDPIEMAVASNAISSMPTIAACQSLKDVQGGSAMVSATGGTMTTSVSSHRVVEEDRSPSLMDRIIGGVNTAVKVGKAVAPVAESLLALL